MKQTMYNVEELIVGRVLDKQYLSLMQCSYLLQLPQVFLIRIHVAETQTSKMILIYPWILQNKKNYMKIGWVG